jgi:hypothetical protein
LARLRQLAALPVTENFHGNWLPWLEREFGWAERTAQNFIGVYEAQQNFKSAKFADFNLPVSALYLITAEKTPAEARERVLDLAANGEACQ